MTRTDRWAVCASAAQRARELLGAATGGSAPLAGLTLVEALLDRKGYDVLYRQSSDTLLGGAWAALFPDGQIAVCDAALPRTRRAFCLAHELGHAVLHTSSAAATSCSAADVAADGGDAVTTEPQRYLLPGETYNPRQQREQEANVFALELLAPADLIRRLFVREGLDARAIAARLELSYSATLQALAGLLEPTRLAKDVAALRQTASGLGSDVAGARRGMNLDQRQREAAAASGSVLVRAGPGSGKTGTLVGRFEYLSSEQRVDPGSILVLTFSNRAAGELRDRLLAVAGPAEQAVMVSTIHAFAHDLLRRYAAAAGVSPVFQVLDRAGALVILRRELPAFARSVEANGHTLPLDRPLRMLRGLLDIVGEAKDARVDAGEFSRRLMAQAEQDESARLQAAFFSWYEAVCSARGLLDYDDLLLRAAALLRCRQDLRAETHAAYPYLLVDEYQDINEACGALLGELIPPSGLWAVGDPTQSIYRWRGADPDALSRWLAAKTEAAGTVQQLALDVNYRSRGPIVRLCAGVAAAIRGEDAETGPAAWHVARERDAEPADPVCLAVADDEHAELDGIAREVASAVAAGARYSDHAVLCATNAQAGQLARGLRLRGIPASRTAAPEDHPAVREVLSVLALAAGESEALIRLAAAPQPDDSESAGTPHLTASAIGLDSSDALAVVQAARSTSGSLIELLTTPRAAVAATHEVASRELAAFLKSLPVHGPQASADADSWTSACKYLFDSPYRAAARVLEREDMDALRALSALLASARTYDHQPPELREASLPAHVRLLLSAGLGLEIDRTDAGDGVRVITMHAAKGLEFPVVFLPNLAQGRFPARGRGSMRMAAGILDGDPNAGRDADDKCLFYVALSRARDRLVLSYAQQYGRRDATPSPLLTLAEAAFAHEPPKLVRWQRQTASEPAQAEPGELSQPETASRPGSAPIEVDHTALETYLQCPKRYYYAHALGLQGAAGHSFAHYHSVLRQALRSVAQHAEGMSPTAARALLDEEWHRPHAAHPYEDLYYDRALAIVLAAAKASSGQSHARSDYAIPQAVTLASGIVHLEIDRLDRREDGSRVAVRFRSGRPTDVHHRETRVALYQQALDAAFGGGTVEQLYIQSGTTAVGRARPSTLQARLNECDAALSGIAEGRYPVNKGDHCPDCPFWLICPC